MNKTTATNMNLITEFLIEVKAIVIEVPIFARDLIAEGPSAIAWLFGIDKSNH